MSTTAAEDLLANIVYCDGACSGNPGPGGWGTITVTAAGHVKELGAGERETTNNRMELVGAIRGINELQRASGRIIVCTDSTYVIRGITQWVWGWRRRSWKTAEGSDVLNRDLWERLMELVSARPADSAVEWRYVRGHIGNPGNERVDKIAVAFSKSYRIKLYDGPLLGYDVAVHDMPERGELPEMRPKEAKTKAHSYVSVVDGVAERHYSWPECEKRVKGRSGARFKKAMSAAEEAEILAGWGVGPLD